MVVEEAAKPLLESHQPYEGRMMGMVGLVRLSGAPLEDRQVDFCLAAGGEDRDTLDRFLARDRDILVARFHQGVVNPQPQPVQSKDGRLLLFLDGEVYNEDLDGENQAAAILEAYLAEGSDLFRRLNGSFLLVLVDPRYHRVMVVSDRTASLGVFFVQIGDLFAFSADMRPLLKLMKYTPRVDSLAVTNFLSSGSILEGRSLVQELQALRQARVLTVENNGFHVRPYLEFAYTVERDHRDPRILEDELYDLMLQAVRRQTRDSVPFAVTLSGGYDSRSILACMRTLYPDRPLTTVTWGADESVPGSDVEVARRFSEALRTSHSFYPLKAEALPDHFAAFVRASEGRVDAAGNYPESLRLLDRIRQELGVGLLFRGNELFGARARVFREKQAVYTGFIPDLSILPGSYWYLKPAIRKRLLELGADQMRRLYRACPYTDPIDCKDHLFVHQRWLGYQSPLTQLKRRVLEERNPYLDNDLVDFVSHLPSHLRVWKNLYATTNRHKIPEFEQTGMAQVISLVNWEDRFRTDPALQAFTRRILLEERNGVDDLFDRRQLELFLERAFRPVTINRRSLWRRAKRKIQRRLDHYELETDLELFRLMILKVWAGEFLQGNFDLD